MMFFDDMKMQPTGDPNFHPNRDQRIRRPWITLMRSMMMAITNKM
jgi:hypothetical protein